MKNTLAVVVSGLFLLSSPLVFGQELNPDPMVMDPIQEMPSDPMEGMSDEDMGTEIPDMPEIPEEKIISVTLNITVTTDPEILRRYRNSGLDNNPETDPAHSAYIVATSDIETKATQVKDGRGTITIKVGNPGHIDLEATRSVHNRIFPPRAGITFSGHTMTCGCLEEEDVEVILDQVSDPSNLLPPDPMEMPTDPGDLMTDPDMGM